MRKRLSARLTAALRRILGEAASGTRNPAQWLVDWIHGGQGSDSGIAVNPDTLMRYAPFWYGVNRISGHVGQLPLVCYQRQDERRRRKAIEHPSYPLTKRRPNRYMSAATFKETLQSHALVYGNGRAAIDRNQRADALELVPLLPDRTRTVLVNGEKWHLTTVVHADGTSEDRKLRDRDVLHIAGLGYDGLVGYPLWEYAKNSVGLGMAAEKSAGRYFRNDGTPGMLLQSPPGMFRDEEEAEKFLIRFRKAHEGLDNRAKIGLLREGITVAPLGQTGRDGQWIEQRRFQRQEAALWLMLEQILGDDSSVSYNSLEQKMLAYLVNCLNRWLVRWEEECNEKLLREREKQLDSHYFKFTTGALLRSDTATTMATGAQAITARIMNPNEVRAWFELEPYPGGDNFENPAITPGASQNPPPAPEPQARAVLVDRLRGLVSVEAKRVRAAAARSGNFCAWLDGFYSDTRFLATLSRAVEGAGGESWQALDHANHSKQQLLEAAGRATPAELAGAIDALTADWPARAEALADAILALDPLEPAA